MSGFTRSGIYPARVLCVLCVLPQSIQVLQNSPASLGLVRGMFLPIGSFVVLTAWRPCLSGLPGCDQAGV